MPKVNNLHFSKNLLEASYKAEREGKFLNGVHVNQQ